MGDCGCQFCNGSECSSASGYFQQALELLSARPCASSHLVQYGRLRRMGVSAMARWVWAGTTFLVLGCGSLALTGCGTSSSPTAGNPIKPATEVNLSIAVQFPTTAPQDATKLVIPSNTAEIEVDAFSVSDSQFIYDLESPLILTPSSPVGTLPAVPIGAELEVIAIARDAEGEPVATGFEFVSVGPTSPTRIVLDLQPSDSDGNQLVNVSGQVVNASTGEPLANATVELAGGVLASVTDSAGQYTLTGQVPLSALVGGTFLLNVTPDSASGCLEQTQRATNTASQQQINVNLNCSDGGDGDPTDPIITLGWGQNPADLDAHLLSPTGERLFFGNLTTSFGTLDIDNRQSVGPETVRVTLASGITDGTYVYCVHWFEGQPTDRTTDLPARVTFTGPGFSDQTFTRFFDNEDVTAGPEQGTWAVASFEVIDGMVASFTALDREAAPAFSTFVCSEFDD